MNFNRTVGYQDNYIIQGFNVLSEEMSQRLQDDFDLRSETYYPEVSLENRTAEQKRLEGDRELDVKGGGSYRKEQSFLRANLFRDTPIAKCCMCGENYPVRFLVAAHIKKRLECSLEEKKDFDNIVAPMCKFGCDELFEKGYIFVEEGTVKSRQKLPTTNRVKTYIQSITSKRCLAWNARSASYFRWQVAQISV